MGFTVPELTAQSKAPLEKGVWEGRITKFQSGESSKKKTPFVQVLFAITDEDAVDTEGEPFGKRTFYGDTFYLTSAAMFRLKNFALEAGVEIPDAGEEFDSLKDYAAALTELFSGIDVDLTVEHEEYVDKDDNDRIKAVVADSGYNFG